MLDSIRKLNVDDVKQRLDNNSSVVDKLVLQQLANTIGKKLYRQKIPIKLKEICVLIIDVVGSQSYTYYPLDHSMDITKFAIACMLHSDRCLESLILGSKNIMDYSVPAVILHEIIEYDERSLFQKLLIAGKKRYEDSICSLVKGYFAGTASQFVPHLSNDGFKNLVKFVDISCYEIFITIGIQKSITQGGSYDHFATAERLQILKEIKWNPSDKDRNIFITKFVCIAVILSRVAVDDVRLLLTDMYFNVEWLQYRLSFSRIMTSANDNTLV